MEDEVAKHGKKMYKIWTSDEHGWQHKLQEFIVEIAIIVLAVTVSIWLHNLSEKRHEHAEAKVYLKGLRTDLLSDIKEMKSDSATYAEQKKFFKYLSENHSKSFDTTYFKNYYWMFNNEIFLVPNISRFEALKYSGKMNFIENKDLLDEIINLYEEKIPMLVSAGKSASNYKIQSLGAYLDAHLLYREDKLPELMYAAQNDATIKYHFERIAQYVPFVINFYKDVIQHNIKLVAMIDEELKK